MLVDKYNRKLSKFLCKSLSKLHDKPLPPSTEREKDLIRELRAVFNKIPVMGATGCSASEHEWIENANRLRNLILDDDPREFLRWQVISGTMFAKYASYVETELKYLKTRLDWKIRWSTAIEESSVGHPMPYWRCPHSSGNLIHHAYHLAQFERKTDLAANSINFIFEFGGGYGSMCRLLHNLGFEGRYVLFDLAPFSALQEFFLKSIGITVRSADTFKTAKRGVICISDFEQLQAILSDRFEGSDSMFIATWSISEAPVTVRNSIFPIVSAFNEFLIAYQHQFQGVDNIAFFEEWKASQRDIEWYEWEIEHMTGNRYLVGSRKADYR